MNRRLWTERVEQPLSLAEAVRRAWPKGVPEKDVMLLSKLSTEDERLVAARLSALLSVEAGTRPASRAPADDARGLTDSGFQSLVRRWRADRSVSTLMPYAGRALRRRGDTADHRAVVAVVDELLKADPEMGLVPLSRQAARRSGSELAPNSVKLIARERRAMLRSDGGWIASRYGNAILSDVCALPAEVEVSPGATAGALIALVVETASGIILGHAVGGSDSALELQRSAMADALAGTITQRLDIVGSVASTLRIVVAPGDEDGALAYARAIRRAMPAAHVVDAPRRRAGDRVADLLDGAVDVLRLRPRGGRPTRRATASTWEETRLVDVAGEAVITHNEGRIALLRSALPDADLASIGRMVTALRPVVEAG